MKKKFYILCSIQIVLLTAISTLPLCSFAIPESKTYMQQIKDLYFQSMDIGVQREPVNRKKPTSLQELAKAAFSIKTIDIPKPLATEKSILAFAASDIDSYNEPHIISKTTAQKMDLVCNAANSKEVHLVNILSTTLNNTDTTPLLHTAAGTTYLIKQLSHPHDNIKKLIATQSAIKVLSTDNVLSSKINKTLKNISLGEDYFLLFYNNIEILHPEITKILYWNSIQRFNNSSTTLELGRLIYPGFFISPEIISGLISLKAGPGVSLGMWALALPKNIIIKLTLSGMIIDSIAVHKALQRALIATAQYVNGAKKLYHLIQTNRTLTHSIAGLSALQELVEPTEKNSAEFKELIQLLDTDTFKGDPSFFSYGGRVLRAYKLMSVQSVRKEFTKIVNAIGEIDAYHALAQKIKSTEKKPVQYALVEFDTTSTTPYIEAVDLWNPFVPESKAIPNTIEMGDDKPRNIILSGPNTGGKSTLCKATLLNLILAQSFGIAAAKYMKFTPFVNLDCFMNMTDDTAGGVSGLQSEANRAEALVAAITAKPHGFHFLLLDEIFTATSPDQAEAMALKLIKYLSGLPNCMFINSVHYDGLKDFADKSKDCRNCHMGAIVDTNGKVLNTYKLAEGRSTVKNAAQVVAATGKLSFLDNIAPAA